MTKKQDKQPFLMAALLGILIGMLLTCIIFYVSGTPKETKLQIQLSECQEKIQEEPISYFELKPDFWGCDFSNPEYYTTGVFFDFDPKECTLGNVNIKGVRR